MVSVCGCCGSGYTHWRLISDRLMTHDSGLRLLVVVVSVKVCRRSVICHNMQSNLHYDEMIERRESYHGVIKMVL